MAAATILIPIAEQIIGKATDMVLERLGFMWNFKRELRKLKGTVSAIHSVLRDAEEKQFHNHQVKDWLEKLSDVMYDADDLLDDLATEARRKAVAKAVDSSRRTCRQGGVCSLFYTLRKRLAYDLKMARAIRAIREKLDVVSEDKANLHLEVCRNEEEALLFRETDSCPPTIVVGREDDKKSIIQLLLSSNGEANISVVPIVGMGGLGKTTLAQLVYDDEGVKAHFDVKVWVYVSQSFDVNVILGKMLRSIDCHSQAGPELDDLQAQLRENIEGKRFLFVLDDVWEESIESWEALGKYLTVGTFGSKVLVTTRSTRVAEVGSRTLKLETSTCRVLPYLLKGLSMEKSWELLVRKALNGVVPQNPAVKTTGRKILEKCDGVPLVLNTISGLLSSKCPESEWPLFLEDELGSISKEENAIGPALKLSFDHTTTPRFTSLASLSSVLVHPLSNLTKLVLEGINEDLESVWDNDFSSCLISLQALWVWDCHRGMKLPSSLCSSTCLMEIDLRRCEMLEYLPPLHKRPSLSELNISWCPKLKGCWWKKKKGNDNSIDDPDDHYYHYDPSEEDEDEEDWPHFPRLSTLSILDCPNLIQMPSFPTLEGLVMLWRTSSEALVRTMMMKVVPGARRDSEEHSTATTTTSLPPPSLRAAALVTPLSKLTVFSISEMDDLESLPEEGLRNLTRLLELKIEKCPRLASLPPAMQSLVCLQMLEISGCPMLSERCRSGDGEDWPNISHIPKIELDGKVLQGSEN